MGGAGYDAAGDPLPRGDACARATLGRHPPGRGRRTASTTRSRARCGPSRACLRIRKALNLFANLRPAMLYPELAQASSLKPEVVAGLDILIVRELTGDIYFGQPRGRRRNAAGFDEGFDTMHYSVPEVERIARVGFEAARKRGRRLCSVDKANVLDTSILWRETVTRLAADYPDVALDAHVRRQRGDAARQGAQAVRRDRHGQHLRRHPLRRSVDACGVDRHAAFGVARRAGQGPVRADPWLRPRHRGAGQGEPARDDPLARR